MDEIETITDESEEPEGEEPWCLTCRDYSDYRRKWSTVSRADMDGGAYPEVVETPHCIDCGQPMLYIRSCRLILWSVNILAGGTWAIGLLATLSLFGISSGSLLAFGLFSVLCLAITRLPGKSRQVLREWKKWKEEESFKELIDQKPKA